MHIYHLAVKCTFFLHACLGLILSDFFLYTQKLRSELICDNTNCNVHFIYLKHLIGAGIRYAALHIEFPYCSFFLETKPRLSFLSQKQ